MFGKFSPIYQPCVKIRPHEESSFSFHNLHAANLKTEKVKGGNYKSKYRPILLLKYIINWRQCKALMRPHNKINSRKPCISSISNVMPLPNENNRSNNHVNI